jgi:glycosyltransferase involved in cell wall biosynthesis
MKRKNVLLYINSLMVGGMEKQTLYLAKYLNKELFNVIVLTQNTDKGGLRDEFYQTGCKILDMGSNSLPTNKNSFNPLLALKLVKVLKKERIDVVYLNSPANLIYFQIAKLFLFRKIIQIGSFRAIDFWKGHLGHQFKKFDIVLAQLLYSTSNHTIVNSNTVKDHYEDLLRINKSHPIIVINNGCDFNYTISKTVAEVRHELNLDRKDFFVLMLARLDPSKDFTTLLESAKILKGLDNSIKLILMGDGPLKHQLEMDVIAFELKDNVFLIGEKVDSYNYINACDLSILSTHGEGFSNTILESMFFKKTVIATRVGGNIDVIGDTNNYGFLVKPRSPKDLAEKIVSSKLNSALTTQIGLNASKRINEMCNISKYVEAYEHIFMQEN